MNFSNILSFLYCLNFNKIKIWYENNKIKVKFIESIKNQKEISSYIKNNKDEILQSLPLKNLIEKIIIPSSIS